MQRLPAVWARRASPATKRRQHMAHAHLLPTLPPSLVLPADFSHFDMIHLGGYVSALSPFWMVAFDTRELAVPAWHPC